MSFFFLKLYEMLRPRMFFTVHKHFQTLSFLPLSPPYSGLEPEIRSYFSFLGCVVIKELTYHQAVQKPTLYSMWIQNVHWVICKNTLLIVHFLLHLVSLFSMICLLSSFQVIFSFWLSFLESLKHVHNVNHMSIPAASRIRTSVIASTCVQYCWAER